MELLCALRPSYLSRQIDLRKSNSSTCSSEARKFVFNFQNLITIKSQGEKKMESKQNKQLTSGQKGESASAEKGSKEAWHAPQLTTYGSVEKITKGSGGSDLPDDFQPFVGSL